MPLPVLPILVAFAVADLSFLVVGGIVLTAKSHRVSKRARDAKATRDTKGKRRSSPLSSVDNEQSIPHGLHADTTPYNVSDSPLLHSAPLLVPEARKGRSDSLELELEPETSPSSAGPIPLAQPSIAVTPETPPAIPLAAEHAVESPPRKEITVGSDTPLTSPKPQESSTTSPIESVTSPTSITTLERIERAPDYFNVPVASSRGTREPQGQQERPLSYIREDSVYERSIVEELATKQNPSEAAREQPAIEEESHVHDSPPKGAAGLDEFVASSSVPAEAKESHSEQAETVPAPAAEPEAPAPQPAPATQKLEVPHSAVQGADSPVVTESPVDYHAEGARAASPAPGTGTPKAPSITSAKSHDAMSHNSDAKSTSRPSSIRAISSGTTANAKKLWRKLSSNPSKVADKTSESPDSSSPPKPTLSRASTTKMTTTKAVRALWPNAIPRRSTSRP